MEEQTKQEAPKTELKPPKEPIPPVSGPLAQLEAWLYDMLVYKAPFHLPVKAKDWIVQYGPWIALVAGILAAVIVIPALLFAVSVATTSTVVFSSLYVPTVTAVAPLIYLSIAVFAALLIIMFISVPMLLKRQRSGWLLLFYSDLVSLVYTVVSSFSYGFFNFGTLLMGLVSAAIGYYLIFQIRSYYKN